jgi:hypothetical protein
MVIVHILFSINDSSSDLPNPSTFIPVMGNFRVRAIAPSRFTSKGSDWLTQTSVELRPRVSGHPDRSEAKWRAVSFCLSDLTAPTKNHHPTLVIPGERSRGICNAPRPPAQWSPFR